MDESSFHVLEDSWSTKSAQDFPFAVVIVNASTIAFALSNSSIVYIGGSPGDQRTCFLSKD